MSILKNYEVYEETDYNYYGSDQPKTYHYSDRDFAGGGTNKKQRDKLEADAKKPHRAIPHEGYNALFNEPGGARCLGKIRYREENEERYFGKVIKVYPNIIAVQKYNKGVPVEGGVVYLMKNDIRVRIVKWKHLHTIPTKEFNYDEMSVNKFAKTCLEYLQLLPQKEDNIE